ncbi:MAG: TlpA family protein disulfide reductase [Clostridia bacterium]|nr:TlpA family protein disulfide reductase [Clostridia bacterium]
MEKGNTDRKKLIIAIIAVAAAVLLLVGANAMYSRLSGSANGPVTEDGTVTEDAPGAENAEPAADFEVLDADMNRTSLSSRFGRPVIVNFWASWCGPCMTELGHFDEVCRKYDGRIEFMMVNLTSQDSVENAKAAVDDGGYAFPVYYDMDGSAGAAYLTGFIPVTVFIDSSGNVAGTHIGSMDAQTLGSLAEALADGRPLPES